jgi:hypothetical protein
MARPRPVRQLSPDFPMALHGGLPAQPCELHRHVDAMEFIAPAFVTEITGSETFVHLDHHGEPWVGLIHGVHELELGQELKVYLDPTTSTSFPKMASWSRPAPMRRPADHGKITLDNLAHSYLPNPQGEDGLCAQGNEP